jgi:hypothetical protein
MRDAWLVSCWLHADYASAIRARCPGFLQHPGRAILTEFGKALVLKTAGVVTRVEDKLAPADPALPVTAITHAGTLTVIVGYDALCCGRDVIL